MKKSIKIIALCLSLTLFGVLFAGCDMLDQMKANHAILSEDKETISFRGETYKRLSTDVNLYYTYYYGNELGKISVTDEDVPVLLSDTYCYYSQYDKTKDIFRVDISQEPESTHRTEFFYIESYAYSYVIDTVYFCNEKDYDTYTTAIENNVLDRIGFEYEKETEVYNYYYTLEVASQEISSEILGYVKAPEKLSKDLFDEKVEDYSLECLMSSLFKCDSEGLLAEPLDGYDIQRDSEGNAYLMNYITETAVKLSDETAKALKDKYFYGDYPYSDNIEHYEFEDSIGIIGSADGETDIVVGEANLFKVDF